MAFGLPFGVFRANLRPIVLLAVGLVLATMAGVAGLARWAAPDLPLASAFVLGAIIAPPDPVAASAVVERMGIRNQLVGILEGEGLVNDSTAIVGYRLAIAAAATGQFSWRRRSRSSRRTSPTSAPSAFGPRACSRWWRSGSSSDDA